MFYLCKKNIAAALPSMSTELGYSNLELGVIGSSLYFTYAIGKFVNGMIADRSDVRKFLPTGLILAGLANHLLCVELFCIHSWQIYILRNARQLRFCSGFWRFSGDVTAGSSQWASRLLQKALHTGFPTLKERQNGQCGQHLTRPAHFWQ